MDDDEALSTMWEFPATWKLLTLLSRPLSFSAPTPAELETALLNPGDHVTTLADCHGRLLGLSAGNSAAKKWLQTVSRFVRQRPDEFTFLAEDFLLAGFPPVNDMAEGVKEEPAEESVANTPKQEPVTSHTPAMRNRLFPTDEQEYFRLRPSSRLLVLHTLAEIVLSEHDSLLSAGSLAEIELHELRCYPVGRDAVGNDYWYFGDFERVYREPTRQILKTRRQKADDDAKAAKEAAKEAAVTAAKVAREEKRKEAQRKQEEIKRKREERKKKSMEKWGPRVAALRTTRASRRAADSLLESTVSPSAHDDFEQRDDHDDIDIPRNSNIRECHAEGSQSNVAVNQNKSLDVTGRRTSGRRRKPSQDLDILAVPTKTPKRPRKTETFTDTTLRNCEGWEMIANGSDNLKQLIERFHPNGVPVLYSEKTLVRTLEEDLLPTILECEEKARKEVERLERKKRNEALLATFTKRSSRVQALAQKREEELRKIAEEEEREKQRLRRILQHEEVIKAQVAVLQNEQSREIRIARRAHGRTEAIERDDQAQKALERQSRRKDIRVEDVPVRRSTRMQKASRRATNVDTDFPGRAGSADADFPGRAGSADADYLHRSGGDIPVSERAREENVSLTEDQTVDRKAVELPAGGDDSVQGPQNGEAPHEKSVDATNGNDKLQEGNNTKHMSGCNGRLASSTLEANVNNIYNWMKNPDDGLPIRVLDKFFLASQTDFADAPLETCASENVVIVGFGILLPPSKSAADAIRVEIEKVDEWVIEYGEEPKMWARSKRAWYELREPAIEFQDAFTYTKRKFEICIRISILGAEMRTAQLTYDAIIDLLSYRYEKMMSYSEEDILNEKLFIVSQMEALNRRSIMMSGFMKELYKRIKSEKDEEESERRKATAKPQQLPTAPVDGDRQKELELARKTAEEEGVKVASVLRRQARRRAAASGHVVVPRAVSSILSAVLKAATKSQPTRKRKRKSDVNPKQQRLLLTPPVVDKDNGNSKKLESRVAPTTVRNVDTNGSSVGVVSDKLNKAKRPQPLPSKSPVPRLAPQENPSKTTIVNGEGFMRVTSTEDGMVVDTEAGKLPMIPCTNIAQSDTINGGDLPLKSATTMETNCAGKGNTAGLFEPSVACSAGKAPAPIVYESRRDVIVTTNHGNIDTVKFPVPVPNGTVVLSTKNATDRS